MRGILLRSFRLKLRLIQRLFLDEISRNRSNFAMVNGQKHDYVHRISLTQKITKNHLTANKIENFNIACNRIKKIIILPGEILSFWRIVGKPTKKMGLKRE